MGFFDVMPTILSNEIVTIYKKQILLNKREKNTRFTTCSIWAKQWFTTRKHSTIRRDKTQLEHDMINREVTWSLISSAAAEQKLSKSWLRFYQESYWTMIFGFYNSRK
ncbi:hypothetical protein L1049_002303 [Liquidambar formosana]|uniref:Uncharacterized protein n=1 Tax=Liquidambar formosana TaxID=63359 RepID=A0AAP0R993_LIQFO